MVPKPFEHTNLPKRKGADLTGNHFTQDKVKCFFRDKNGKSHWFRKVRVTYYIDAAHNHIPVKKQVLKDTKSRPKWVRWASIVKRYCKFSKN